VARPNTYMERILQMKKELYELSKRLSECHPEDTEFYARIAEQFAVYIQNIQSECLKSSGSTGCCAMEPALENQ